MVRRISHRFWIIDSLHFIIIMGCNFQSWTNLTKQCNAAAIRQNLDKECANNSAKVMIWCNISTLLVLTTLHWSLSVSDNEHVKIHLRITPRSTALPMLIIKVTFISSVGNISLLSTSSHILTHKITLIHTQAHTHTCRCIHTLEKWFICIQKANPFKNITGTLRFLIPFMASHILVLKAP